MSDDAAPRAGGPAVPAAEAAGPLGPPADQAIPAGDGTGRSGLLSASASMAAGTVVSRLTGFIRSGLILAAIGKSLDADVFTQANTVPNSLYILVAGGVFNVVLVPQLVRAMRNDADGGEAYASRVLSLGVLVLAGATAVLVVAVPLVARVAFPGDLFEPDLAPQLQSAHHLMRYCMPQVFFYGVFVLVGQLLNSRQRFGPMMWAPIVNNVIACAVLVTYLATYGSSDSADGFTGNQELLLGLGSTLGVAAQAAVLVPYLRAAGVRLRPRFDFRGVGLGHTLRLGLWTLLFVITNQIAYFVVTRIAVGSSAEAAQGSGESAGATVYQNAFLITQVPHAIITVSLVTATMPLLSRLAAEEDTAAVRGEVRSTLRLVLTAVVPVAAVLACLGQLVASMLFGYGAVTGDTQVIGDTIAAFAPGLVFFTVHYLLLRGFYAGEDTRTPFFVQLGLSLTNIAAAILFTVGAPPGRIAMLLALAYGTSYLVGMLASGHMLSRRLGGLVDADLVRFGTRLVASAAVSAVVMLTVSRLLPVLGLSGDRPLSAAASFALAGGAGALGYLLAARVTGLREVAMLGAAVRRRA